MTMNNKGKGVKRGTSGKKWVKEEKRQKVEPEKEDLYKPPTNQELNSLKQTEDLFHSSLFRLQIEELLNEVKVKKTKSSAVTNYVQSITSFLSILKDETFSDVYDHSSTDVKFPLCQTHAVSNDETDFVFSKPKNVQVLGGFSLGLATRSNVTVDVIVEMPRSMFSKKDCSEHCYHRKRAIYLSCLARKLKDNKELNDSLHFTYFHGDFLKPILILKPKGKILKRFTLAILPHPPQNFFNLGRFVPTKSNIKSSWFFQKKKLDSVVDLPTPKYNTSFLIDLTFEHNRQYLNAVVGDHDNVRDGIILLKVWLHQRELDQGFGSFSPFIVTLYVVYLLQTKKLNVLMSSYQIARSVWLNLKQSDWSVKGISLAQLSESGKQPPTMAEFHDAFEVVFVDPSGYVNVCANMSKVTFQRVQHEAELAIECIDNTETNGFHCLFMTPLPFLRKFDHLIHIDGTKSLRSAVKKCNLHPLLVDNCGNYAAVIVSKVIEVLKSGLGARVKFLDVQLRPQPKWGVDESPPSASDLASISIGLLLDPILSMSILDKGPPADSLEAAAFKEFWGDKSELRRFHDSSICEAVVWPRDTISERRMVCQHVACYVLESHVGIDGGSIRYIGGGMDELLGLKFPKDHEYAKTYGTGEEQTVDVLTTYDSLVKQLRSLDDLPLKFSSIQGTSAVFRYTEVFPQLPVSFCGSGRTKSRMLLLNYKDKVPSFLKPQRVILKLESSNKWPHDLQAIRHLKAAFYIQLSKQLREKCFLLGAPFPEHIDVFKEGYVFRLVIVSSQELVALKVYQSPTGMIMQHDTKESTDLEIASELMPKVTSSLHGLQMRHGSFSATCRLAKRWVAAQLLADYVPDVSIDLIVSQLYLLPYPFTPPSCPQVGFLRFLQLLVVHDWKTVPFIVNLNEELKKEEITEIHNFFINNPSSRPPMFIATPYDKFGSLLTKQNPTPQIVHRLILLATETTKTLEDQLLTSSIRFNPKIAFRPPLEPYDVVIHLNEKQIPTNFMSVDSGVWDTVKNFGKYGAMDAGECNAILPVVDYNPAAFYLKELRDAFGHLALFFYDPFGGSCIGVLFNPSTFKRQLFKIGSVNGLMVSNERTTSKGKQVKVIPNVKAILEDFEIIGRGLVKHVETREDQFDFD